MRVLVTGAGGFVGRALCSSLRARGVTVVAAGRTAPLLPNVESVAVGELGGTTDWAAALAGVDGVVHLAARTHVLREAAADAAAEYGRINTDATRRLAEQSVAAGIRRLVLLSSVKVNGDATRGRAFVEDDPPGFTDAYGRSKWEAERTLWRAVEGSVTEAAVIRPPLVYGPGVKGNFLSLLKLCRKGWPLPLGAVDNRRSLIGLTNLVDAIVTVLTHPAAAGRTYLVRDGEDLSTTSLIRRLSAALGVKPTLWPAPQGLLRLGAQLAGRAGAADRLLGSLEIDDDRVRCELGWLSPCSVDEELAATAHWFLTGG